jgi:endonuclease YncB( thermonuclease family)
MATGRLEINGTIDLTQFWPVGSSDADTTKILITPDAGGICFNPGPSTPLRVTQAFEGATVVGKTTKPAIDRDGRITVRLQGVDAPELHYRPEGTIKKKNRTKKQQTEYLKWNLEYRQPLGETSTWELKKELEKAGPGPIIKCRVVSAVDEPDDVFDTYGRLVGDILVTINGQEVNINHWLVANGHAMPTFYSSMSEPEINALLNSLAQAKGKGIWAGRFAGTMPSFKWDSVYRGKGVTFDAKKDKGKVLMPKLFRRQAIYEVNKKASMLKGAFVKYLKEKKDDLHLLSDFLSQGPAAAPIHYLAEFVSGKTVLARPEALVFRENASRLTKPGVTKVTWW